MIPDPDWRNLTPEETLALILQGESEVERLLVEGKITEWAVWECYFRLMYEANLWALKESALSREFWQIRERVAKKIDWTKFDPFLSKDPTVVLVARDIAARKKIPTKFDN